MTTTAYWWNESDETDPLWCLDANGIFALVTKSVAPEKGMPWFWKVEAGSTRCEWPELIDCGTAKTAQSAKNKAAKVAAKADRTYPTVKYD